MKKAIFPIITIMILLLAGCTFAFKTNVTVEVQIDGVDESSFDNDISIISDVFILLYRMTPYIIVKLQRTPVPKNIGWQV